MIAHSAAALSSSHPSPAAFPDSHRSVYVFLFIFYLPPTPSQSIRQEGDNLRVSPSRLLLVAACPLDPDRLVIPSPSFFFKTPPPKRSFVFLSTDATTPVSVCAHVKVFFFPLGIPSSPSAFRFLLSFPCSKQSALELQRPQASSLSDPSMSALISGEPPASAAAVIWPPEGGYVANAATRRLYVTNIINT